MADTQGRGKAAEDQAATFLRRQGLTELQRNYRVRGGEIDLIMQDGRQLVFVEVRYRQHSRYGGAAASITAGKQARLSLAARHYLLQHGPDRSCRFDVVAIDGSHPPNWIKDAFQPG
jgi:putative endonuclease